MINPIPLSLYIHIPWCVKKCPYCDFNSYANPGNIPEEAYIQVLQQDFKNDLPWIQGRPIHSIFFGGGTPSLFSPQGIEQILNQVTALAAVESNAEITLEANPGTLEHRDFREYRQAGITRISLGAQSFQNDKLKQLGRVHEAKETIQAIELLEKAHFDSFNLDLMYGLPQQSLEDALFDLNTALRFSPKHISWYHLTIEPNTIYFHKPPLLPPEKTMHDIEQAGQDLLVSHGLKQYEISGFAKVDYQCQHNLNYWQFGDYLGIGAGAHGKITDLKTHVITRYWKTRYPKDYLNPNNILLAGTQQIPTAEIPLEFMLNTLRLTAGTTFDHFEHRTQLSATTIEPKLKMAVEKGLLKIDNRGIIPTALGKRFLNDLLALFY